MISWSNARFCPDPSRPNCSPYLFLSFQPSPPSPIPRFPPTDHRISLSFYPARARARVRSPFLYDRPDPVSLSLFLTHSISPFPPPRACVRVGACGSAVELVNGRTRLTVRCSRRQLVLSQCVPYAGTVKYSSQNP